MSARKDAQMFTYSPSSCWTRLALNTTFKPFTLCLLTLKKERS